MAALIGPGEGWWRHELDGGIQIAFGWRNGVFRIELGGIKGTDAQPSDADASVGLPISGATFEGTAVPEVTPNPRTIRFVTGDLHTGPSRWYESATQVDDPRVARLFAEFEDVANVLVGPDFVAVGIRRPDRWEQLLDPILRVIDAEFHSPLANQVAAPGSRDQVQRAAVDAMGASPAPTRTALDRAWGELRDLNPQERADLERVLAAAVGPDVATRQVAARLLIDADDDVAIGIWRDLLGDPSRSVRRATLDAMVDAGRPALRALFERALADSDAWTRWKALRGLADLGVGSSREAVAALATDNDFRVRLEAARVLRGDE
jgi:HEAT repeat protein